jgi:hypothetical protein
MVVAKSCCFWLERRWHSLRYVGRAPTLTGALEDVMDANSKGVKMKIVYSISERENGKSYWTRIGVGFVNQDGSINLRLDAIPMNGQNIQVREYEPYDPSRSYNNNNGANGGGPRPPRPYREPPADAAPGPLAEPSFGGLG